MNSITKWALTGIVSATLAAQATAADYGKIGKVSTQRKGNTILVEVATHQNASIDSYWGELEVAIEVTDAKKVRLFGATRMRQESRSAGDNSRCVWSFSGELPEGVELDRPRISGYWVRFFKQGDPDPLDEKKNGTTGDMVKWREAHKDDKRIHLRYKEITVNGRK